MTELGSPIQGVTLYSFTRAFHGREFDLEGLIRKVAGDGYGPGLEIVGFSSFRNFPEVDDRFAGWFKDLVAESGLVQTSLAINADIGSSATWHKRKHSIPVVHEFADYLAPHRFIDPYQFRGKRRQRTAPLGMLAVFWRQVGLHNCFPRRLGVRLFGRANQLVGDIAESLPE